MPRTLLVFDSTDEQQSYDFFRSRSVGELTELFHTDERFWHMSVLQLSMTQPEVRYALTALGALHRKYAEGDNTAIPEDTTDAQTRFALEQCNRSIKSLLERAGSEARYEKVSTLVACLLYTCVASIQGHQTQSIMHFRNGLKLLDSLGHSSATVDSMSYWDTQFQSFVTTLSSLEVQARSLICEEDLPPWPTRIKIRSFPSSRTEIQFTSLSEARDFFESVLSDFQCFAIDRNAEDEWLLSPTTTPRRSSMDKYHLLVEKHASGVKALNAFITDHDDLKGRDEKMILMLRLHICITEMYLRVYPLSLKHGDSAYDHIDVYYLRMISLARQILGCSEENLAGMLASLDEVEDFSIDTTRDRIATTSKHSRVPLASSILKRENNEQHRPVFTFSQGIVGPLSTTGIACRTPSIRKEAMALLLLYPRREGLWDSHTAGRCGWVAMQIEEELTRQYRRQQGQEDFEIKTASDVPIECRVRGVDMKYIGPRSGELRFNTMKKCEDGEMLTIVMVLEW
ncbi:hypothetical protein H2200_001663 [Cladophialophora chaetospira]|uniref:C6 zinc finger domain protein n=1 Tax=Cladophialophora chaetospira TaxID=386627 RepID=A0AA38XLF1_9EURO|nr:hypothetical protein H2200_001663 [Cladophialophora chaetospira]